MASTDPKKLTDATHVSLGETNDNALYGRKLHFKPNLVKNHKKLDTQRLVFCQFLSLRSSSFDEIDVRDMLSLFYIDIARSKIKNADF